MAATAAGMMAAPAKMGSLRERLLSTRGYSDFRFSDIDFSDERSGLSVSIGRLVDGFYWFCKEVKRVLAFGWDMGRSDPRKLVFSVKMGLALMLVSLLVFLKEPFKDISRYYVWAILTVVVVFEFSIGATLNKGFNRGIGTLSAGGLALGMAELSHMAGDFSELVIVSSIFLVGSLATYAKQYPRMRPYEYGFRVFLLTYCIIMVSGYRTGEFIDTAVTRFWLIVLGAGVGFAVNLCIFPIWAGEDLHNLVAKNFMGVANSLEGCVNGYINCVEYERVPSKILTYQASDDPVYNGYRAAVESTSQEDALVGFAVWEPPHGPYRKLNYPWKNYVKVSGALRHCAFMVMALHGCILSEIQAPAERRRVFQNELRRVGVEGAKVLRELGNKVKKMERLGDVDILYEVHEAAEELQNLIDRKSYLLVNSESWEIGNRTKDLVEPLDFINFDDDKNKVMNVKSHSEAILNLRSIGPSLGTSGNTIPKQNAEALSSFSETGLPDNDFKNQISWPPGLSLPGLEESKTYESASALSLATFASLLIEFVARLQNIVDSFEELSQKASFKEPVLETDLVDRPGLLNRLLRTFRT